jgi:hypothetical protein
MIDPTDLLEILDSAHPSPLWAAIVENLEKVAVQAELHGFRADPTEKAVTAAYDAITGCFNNRYCAVCMKDIRKGDDTHILCDRCFQEGI